MRRSLREMNSVVYLSNISIYNINMPKSVAQCIDDLHKYNNQPPTDITKLYKKVKELGGGKSGAFVFLVKDGNKKYILKYYNQQNNRPLRELICLCRLSSVDGFPKINKMGITIFPKDWINNVKPNNDRGYFVVMSIVPGEELSKINIKMSKKQALNVSLSILHRLLQARQALGNDFEHYDLHPNNIFIDKKSCQHKTMSTTCDKYDIHCPAVYIIDFDLVKASSIKCIPDSSEHSNKKIGYLGLLQTVVPVATWSFVKKWTDSILETSKKIFGVCDVINTDIRNWLVISSVLFEVNGIKDTIEVCKDAEDCFSKNIELFESLKKKR
jgi:hypothetical protein